jgi:Xaa-Pro aminopeptidase
MSADGRASRTGPEPELEPLEVAGRLDRLRSLLVDAGPDGRPVEGLLVTTPANIRWLTGFSGSAGLLLVTAGRAVLTTDGRYRTQSAEQLAEAGVASDVDVEIGGVQAQREALRRGAAGLSEVGLEAEHVTWSSQRSWAELLAPVSLVPTRGLVEQLRLVKDPGEVARMARAASIADEALAAVLPLLAGAGTGAGELTEARFAAALDHAMRERGAEDRAFETIVASGENSAKPHARPGRRLIRPGDPVVVDFGAVFEGYRSDMTRTFCVGGPPTGELARVFQVVAESQRVGVARVEPGVTAGAVDQACREAIAASGWAERFEHGTGHGVGLDIHEGPSVGPGSTAILEPGTVVTVEPGVYLPGTGGVRIEDTLVVTEHGSRPLTRFPKEVAV